ncbi:hypothetical protein L6E12_12740 [Actinokineospora sp. PR83]|uniref:hypothetical protein n=1 Tax=Actinokineospora sp. PR83 TaxID=2884908 RepID=UPI001F182243|nr:hypothetical protein [Actinokineospora sp. PR83]MCG8916658.1 hypothetical protein [Actinokineospora sp. PR83]
MTAEHRAAEPDEPTRSTPTPGSGVGGDRGADPAPRPPRHRVRLNAEERAAISRFLRWSAGFGAVLVGLAALLGWLVDDVPTAFLLFVLAFWIPQETVDFVREYRRLRRTAAARSPSPPAPGPPAGPPGPVPPR